VVHEPIDHRRGHGVIAEDLAPGRVDWRGARNNDFFLASQLWISGDLYNRRADLVAFVNGIPLVFIALKASHKRPTKSRGAHVLASHRPEPCR